MPFSWEGKYHHYPVVSVWPGLIQRPLPPLFSSGNSPESIIFAATHNHGLAVSFTPVSYVAQVISHYRAEAGKHGWQRREDQIVYRGNFILAQTDEEALSLAAQLAKMSHFKRPPLPASAAANGKENAAPPVSDLGKAQFCGSPHTIVKQMKTLYDLGVDVVDLIIPPTLMSQQQVLHSLELFGKEVLPRIHQFERAG